MAVSCPNKENFARSLRSRAYCSNVNTVGNPNSVGRLTLHSSTSDVGAAVTGEEYATNDTAHRVLEGVESFLTTNTCYAYVRMLNCVYVVRQWRRGAPRHRSGQAVMGSWQHRPSAIYISRTSASSFHQRFARWHARLVAREYSTCEVQLHMPTGGPRVQQLAQRAVRKQGGTGHVPPMAMPDATPRQ